MMIALAKIQTDEDRDIDPYVDAARRFYTDVLHGRQLGALSFDVSGVIVQTGYQRSGESDCVELTMEDPAEVAARCWNAGFTVLVDREGAFGLLDPFGLRIDITAP